jgi:hypothetical protein
MRSPKSVANGTPVDNDVKTKRVAKLDERNRLVGFEVVPADQEGIDFGDLPTNGSYIWEPEPSPGRFRPVGLGLPKVKNGVPPHSMEFVLARMIEAFTAVQPDAVPVEANEWLAWYSADLRKREEERKG